MTFYVNSTQYISIAIAASATTGTFNLSAPTGTYFPFLDGYTTTDTSTDASSHPRVTFASNVITVTRGTASAATITVKICIVDATSSLINSIQWGTTSLTSGQSSNTSTISAVTNANASIHYLGVSTTGSASLSGNDCRVALSGTTVTLTKQFAGSVETGAWVVIEWTGAALQSATQQFSSTASPGTTSRTQAITSVTMANTITLTGGQAGNSPSNEATIFQRGQLTSATVFTITTNTTPSLSLWYNFVIVEFISAVLTANGVQRGTTSLSAATSANSTITGVVVGSAGLLFLGNTSTATSFNPATSRYAYILSNSTTVNMTVNSSATGVGSFECPDFVTAPTGTLITIDFGVRSEFLSTIRDDDIERSESVSSAQADLPARFENNCQAFTIDRTLVAESLQSSRTDYPAEHEFLGTIKTDITVRVETISSIKIDAGLQLESMRQAFQSDTGLRDESITTAITDGAAPSETKGTTRIDSPLQIENISTQRIDLNIEVESLSSQRQDLTARAESLTTVLADRTAQLESVGVITVTVDPHLPFEFLATARSETPARDESLASQVADVTGRLETTATLRADLIARFDTLSTLYTDLTARDESLVSVTTDRTAPAEALTSVKADRTLPLDWQGQISVTIDSNMPLETIGSIKLDRGVPAEAVTAVIIDRTVPGESVRTQRVDITLPIEMTVNLRADTPARSESVTGVMADRAINFESVATAISNSVAMQEFLSSAVAIVSNSTLMLEWLQSSSTELTVSFEIQKYFEIPPANRILQVCKENRTLEASLEIRTLQTGEENRTLAPSLVITILKTEKEDRIL